MSASDPFGLVGQVLDGQFRVDKLVGEGGFSAVYRGHHQGLNEPIAVKCLKLPAALGTSLVDTFVQRFRDESRILYRLSQGNLNVVRSIAAGTTQAPATGALVPYMVLEWLEGRSMQNDFTVRRTLGETGRSLQDVVKLFDSAADGLGYAHAQGVAHRDLNPGNLFLAQTAAGVKMKVLDFGVAKLMHEGALNMGPRAATIGQIKIFAPAYGAPEQFDDRIGAVGAASDVYAFALIVLEALHDKNVVEGQHLGDFANSATDPEKRPTPRMLGIDVPDEVEAAFKRATALDPKQRWQSAADFWQSLTIALKLATERKYEKAAQETPPLAMGDRSDRTDRAAGRPDQAPAVKQPGDPKDAAAAGRTPMARTMPLGAQTPGLPPGFPRPVGAGGPGGAPRPRTPTTIGIPAPANVRLGPAAAMPLPVVPAGAARTLTSPGQTSSQLAPPAPPPRLSRPPSNMGMPASTTGGAGVPPLAAPPVPRPSSVDRAELAPPSERAKASERGKASDRPAAPPTTRFPDDTANPNAVADASDSPFGEEEDEATKVHAPTPEVLRTLALHDAANARAAADKAMTAGRMKTQMGGVAVAGGAVVAPPPPPPPPALAPAPHSFPGGDLGDDASALADAARAAPMKPPHVDHGRPSGVTPLPPPSGATLMMAPQAHQAAMRGAPMMGALPAPPPPMMGAPPANLGAPPPPLAGLTSTLAIAPPMTPQTGRTATPPFGFAPAPPHHGSSIQGLEAPWQNANANAHAHAQHGMQGPAPYGQASAIVPPLGSQPSFGPPDQQQQQQPFHQSQLYPQSPQSPQNPQGPQSPQNPQGPFGRPSPQDQFPPSSAQPAQAAPAKPLPIVPIAIGLGLLALGGIGLGIVAFTMRAPHGGTGADAMASAATSVTASAVPADTASAAPTAEPEADAASAPVVAEEDAAATAATGSATGSASAAPPASAPPTTATATGPVFTWPPPTTATATASAKPPVDPNAFSESAARAKLGQANGVLAFCKKEGGVTGPGSASVTFGSDGSVTGVAIDAPYAGTKEGDCVAGHFRRAKVNAFTGSPQTVRHSFEVPK